jgi:hypothetical protein
MSIRLILACLLLPLSTVPAWPADSSAGIGEEFQRALLRLAQSGQLQGAGDAIVVEQPARRMANLGLLIDRDHDDGLLVLGTLPGGSAERIGLRPGDRLVEANGTDLRGRGANERMRSIIDGLDEDRALALSIQRGGVDQRLAGVVEAVDLPAMRVELRAGADGSGDGGAGAGRVAGDPASSCARVTTFHAAPRSRDLYPARLLAIDGELPGPSAQDSFRIEPGRHVLTVAEIIDEREFSPIANQQRSRHGRQLVRTIEIDARPGVTYLLSAQLLRDRRGSILDAGYWQPVLWKERAEPCR